MREYTIPPLRSPARYPPRQPIVLPPRLDPSCVLCFLPIRCNKWFDYSGKGNHGTIKGATWTAKGLTGPGLSLDGINDYADCGHDPSLNITAALSVEARVKPGDVGAASGVIVSKAAISRWTFQYDGSGFGAELAVWLGGTRQIQLTTWPGNYKGYDAWYHLVFTWSLADTAVYLYIDGEVAASNLAVAQTIPSDAVNHVFVGRSTSGQSYQGLIDLVRIYNRTLTAAEVRYLYRQEMGSLVL